MVNDNVTILLISSSKLLKNKFIECLNTETTQNHFTLMTKTIESLKSLSERINVPCLICDYLTEQANNTETTNNAPPDTTYVQLVDATDKNLINNLISRSMNKESNKKFNFNVNAIIYLYDEVNSDTFAYIQALHKELQKTFAAFLNSDSLRFVLCNMIGATIQAGTSEDPLKLIRQTESFLDQFNNNIQYVTQRFENTILGAKPIIEQTGDDNNLKVNFDEIINQFNMIRLNQSVSKSGRLRTEKQSDDSYKIINSLSDSLQSANEEVKKAASERNSRLDNLKENYQGEMANNLRNGFGIYVYDNKFFRYEGEWKNGKKHGMGKLVMRDGSYYEGEFKNGEIVGKGYKFNKENESEYTGDFQEGLYQGKGTLRVRKLFTYQGDFFENMRHGYGELNEFKMNRNYQGQWYYNKRHGQGIQKYPDGSSYTGDWIRDKRQGHGEVEYLDGSYYDGQWRNDSMNGKGIFKHCSGYYYDGLFSNGIPNKIASTKLVISIEQRSNDEETNEIYKIDAAKNFKATVHTTVDDTEETMPEDGRKIQLSFGIKLDVANTTKYVNQIATEFGFSMIPILLENSSDLKLRNESAIIDEDHNSKLMAASSTNEKELMSNLKSEHSSGQNEPKTEIALENSTFMVDSFSSKIQEVILPNENGIAKFESLSVDSIKLPLREGEQKPNKKDRLSLGPNEGSYRCVIIAEDCSKPLLFGHKVKSTYKECIVNNKDAKLLLSQSKTSLSLKSETESVKPETESVKAEAESVKAEAEE